MVELSYDKVGKTIILMSVYLIMASVAFNVLASVLQFNIMDISQSLLNGGNIEFSLPPLPDFNIDNFSFDLLKVWVNEGIHKFIDVIFPVAVGVIDTALINSQPSKTIGKTLFSRNIIKVV